MVLLALMLWGPKSRQLANSIAYVFVIVLCQIQAIKYSSLLSKCSNGRNHMELK